MSFQKTGKTIGSDYIKYSFPIIKQLPINKNADLLNNFEDGYSAPGTRCMRFLCQESRWVHPDKGSLVCCKEHSMEIILGKRSAPPLRGNIDYNSSSRKTFLVTELSKVDSK